ncbi:MAG TPA: hypothetical protein VIJ42_09230 [Stellaceae bacterium]
MIDERRHFRIGDAVEFAAGKDLVVGTVSTFRLTPRPHGEMQTLSVTTVDGRIYHGIDATTVRPIAGRATQGIMRAEVRSPDHIDARAVARRAVTPRGAVGVSVHEIRALAADYLALLELTETS